MLRGEDNLKLALVCIGMRTVDCGKAFNFMSVVDNESSLLQVLMAGKVMELAVATEGKEALAIEAFANALLKVPTIIADNAGYDSADLVSRIRAKHAQG